MVADFGVEIRYPDNKIELSESNIEEAIEIARAFRRFIVPMITPESMATNDPI